MSFSLLRLDRIVLERNCLLVGGFLHRNSAGIFANVLRLLDDLVGLDIGSVVASAGGGQLEGLDGEGEVLVIRVVGQEPKINRLINILII